MNIVNPQQISELLNNLNKQLSVVGKTDRHMAGKGLIRYRDNKDTSTRGDKNIEYLIENVFSKEDWSKYSTILDVGCGNGRVNKIYKEYFNEIYNIDKHLSDVDNEFNYDNVTFIKEDFLDFNSDIKVDVISFIFSFYIFNEKNSVESIIKKCFNLLNDNGCILVVCTQTWGFSKVNEEYHFDANKLLESYNGKIVKIENNRSHFYMIINKR